MGLLTLLGRFTLPGLASAVPLARHCVEAALRAAGYADVDAVVLLVSELATNAITHTRSGYSGGVVTVEVAEGRDDRADGPGCRVVRVEVGDQGSASVPAPRAPDLDSPSGRGLWLVGELADAWGVREAGESRVVWFELGAETQVTFAGRHTVSGCSVNQV